MFSLQDAVAATRGEAVTHGAVTPDIVFRGVTIDSRSTRPGDLFVAIPGETFDGHDFIGNAAARGAAGALVRRDAVLPPDGHGLPLLRVPDTVEALGRLASYWRGQLPATLRVAGITGSVGKSSTKELAYSVLEPYRRVVKSPKSFNNELGLPLSVLAIPQDAEVALLEMGTYGPGELTQLAAIARPDIGVVTNVGPSHLERMGSLEAIAVAKGELIAAIPALGKVVLNADDPRVRSMSRLTGARPLLYGLGPEADLRATELATHGVDGISFALTYQGQRRETGQVALVGAHHVYTALAAVAIALVVGLSVDEAVAGLKGARAQFRATLVAGPNGSTVLDDSYNASPASANAALAVLQDIPATRRIAVLGDMLELGTYEEAAHREIGRAVVRVVDELVTVGPRARLIAAEARREGLPAPSIHEFPDKHELADSLRSFLRPGDVVLIKGSRGLALETVIEELRETQV